MALFEKKECCICGGKAGMLTRQKLSDKSYLCGDCVAKCSPNLHSDDFGRMTKQNILDSMQYTIKNNELYRTQFHETDAVKTGLLNGTKVISIDGTNGWWVIANQNNPDVFGFDQVASWQLRLDTFMKSEEEKKENRRPVYPPRPDMPVCRSDEKINRMYVRINLRHPFITYVDVNVMNAMIVTDGDIESGYESALQLFTMFERYRYQQPYAQQPYAQQSYAQQPYTQQSYAPQQNYGYAGSPVNSAPVSGAASAVNVAEELKKFKELADMGVITEQEFEAKKRQLLGL